MVTPSGPNPFELDASCGRCRALGACRSRVVHGHGRTDADVMFVGTAPGRQGADATGVPFTGDEAGRRLQWLLRTIGLAEGDEADGSLPTLDCFVTNAIRCATPEGRAPRRSEREACADWLAEEILRVDPAVIIPMGTLAGHAVFDLLLDEPFPGVRDAHGEAFHVHGYRIHPIAHVLRLPAEELRTLAQRLVRVAVHARSASDPDSGALDTDTAGRSVFRFALARRLADVRARRAAGGGPERGDAYWLPRMTTFAGVMLAALRSVRARPGVRPGFRFLGTRRGGIYVLPLDAARTVADLHDGLSFDPTPRGVFEYWLYHQHVWTPADSERFEVVHRESRLLSLFDQDVARELVPVGERRKLFPPPVEISGEGPSGVADLTVVLHDRQAARPTLRIDRLRIGLEDGRVRFADREDRSCDPDTVPRPGHSFFDDDDTDRVLGGRLSAAVSSA